MKPRSPSIFVDVAALPTRPATVLFADLRGYTTLAERLPAGRVANLLDELFQALASALESEGGHLYHLLGDGLMAGFGLGQEPARGAQAALAAGTAMLRRFESLAIRWSVHYAIEAGLGVGLHHGEVAEATLGPLGRRTTTLVGDTVNVAARLCERARAGELLLSGTVATLLLETDAALLGPPFQHLPAHTLRGRAHALDVWCLPAPAERPAVAPLPAPVPVRARPAAGTASPGRSRGRPRKTPDEAARLP